MLISVVVLVVLFASLLLSFSSLVSCSPTIDQCQMNGQSWCNWQTPGCTFRFFNQSMAGIDVSPACVPSSWTRCSDFTQYQFCNGAFLINIPSSPASATIPITDQSVITCEWSNLTSSCHQMGSAQRMLDYCHNGLSWGWICPNACAYTYYDPDFSVGQSYSHCLPPTIRRCSQLNTESLCSGAKVSSYSLGYYSAPYFECRWCPEARTCVFARTNCSSCAAYLYPTNQTHFENVLPDRCKCEFQHSKENCSNSPSSLSCVWCDDLGVCLQQNNDNNHNNPCSTASCNQFDGFAAETGSCLGSSCSYCYANQSCWNTKKETCSCTVFDSKATCNSFKNCAWRTKVLTGTATPRDYCAVSYGYYCYSASQCSDIYEFAYAGVGLDVPSSALAVNVPNTMENFEVTCRAAGCEYSLNVDSLPNSCGRSRCPVFFLDGFIVQPILLTVIGMIKDLLVLILLGVFGDAFWKFVQTKFTLKFKYWKNKWDNSSIEPNLERKIYVNDYKYEDGANISFQEYCNKIIEKYFELPTSTSASSENNNNNTKAEEQEKILQNNARKVFDAVSFCIYSTGLWIEIDIVDEDDANEEKGEKEENSPRNESPRVRSAMESTLISSSTQFPLTQEIISSRVKLQKTVEQIITTHASSVVFIASSRSAKIRAASSINQFPTAAQLSFYLLGIIVELGFCLEKILRPISQQIIQGELNPVSCSSNTTSSQGSLTIGSIFNLRTFVMLGFRFLNSSAFTTSVLIFVKTVRGFWNSFRNRFYEDLDLPERLPLMSLYSSRAVQLLLFLYFSVGLIFFGWVFANFFEGGLSVAGEAMPMALGVIIALIVVNNLILWVIRKCCQPKKALDNENGTHEEKEISANIKGDDDDDDDENELNSNVNRRDVNDQDYQNQDVVEKNRETKQSTATVAAAAAEARQNHLKRPNSKLSSIQADDEQSTLANFFDLERHRKEQELFEIAQKQEEVKQEASSSLQHAAPRSMAQALLVFLFAEEIPTLFLSFFLQTLYTTIASAVNGGPQQDFAHPFAGMECIGEQWVSSATGAVSQLSAYVPFL